MVFERFLPFMIVLAWSMILPADAREISSAEEAMRLGDQAFLNGRLPQAESSYRQAAKLAAGQAEPHFRLSQLYYSQGRYDEAERSLDRAAVAKKGPVSARIIEIALQKFDEARPDLRAIEAARGSEDRAALMDAHAAAARRWAEGPTLMAFLAPHLEHLLSADPGNQALMRAIAEGYYLSSDSPNAFLHFKKLAKKAPSENAFLRLAEASINVGAYDDARWAYKRALRLAAARRDAELMQGLRKKIRALPVFADKIDSLIEEEEHGEAFRQLRKRLVRNPSDPWAVIQMGRVYESLGRNKQAHSLYRRVIRWRPEDPGGHYALARFHLLRSKKFDKALEGFLWTRSLLEESISFAEPGQEDKLRDFMRDVTRNIAYIQMEVMGRPQYAVREFEWLVRNGKPEARDHYNLGIAYLRLKKRTAAFQEMKKAIDLDPKSEIAKDAEHLIASQRIASQGGFEIY